MDNLTSLNIIPFLGLMNVLEVKYLHIPEVYRTLLAILCDYNPLVESNATRTKRYLRILLVREPELAQCLLNFMEEPDIESQQPSVQASVGNSQVTNQHEPQNPLPCSSNSSTTPLTTKASSGQIYNRSIPDAQGAVIQSSGGPSDIETSCATTCTQPERASSTYGPADDSFTRAFHTSPTSVSSSSKRKTQVVEKSSSAGTKLPFFAPVVNIHHRDVFPSDMTHSQQQDNPLHQLPSTLPTPDFPADTLRLSSEQSGGRVLQTDGNLSIPASATRKTCSSRKSKDHDGKYVSSKVCAKIDNCKAVQTQTSEMDPVTRDEIYKKITAKRTKLAKEPRGNSDTRDIISMDTISSTGQPSPITTSVCLSKLLGQPSVAYLPAGHFIDNRNSIVGSCKSTLLNSKITSAAAKLHLLSTQAGSEKNTLMQDKHTRSSIASAIRLRSLSVYASSDQSARQNTTLTNISSEAARNRKMHALSQIPQRPKLDVVAASAPAKSGENERSFSEIKTSAFKKLTVSSDKTEHIPMASKTNSYIDEDLSVERPYYKQLSPRRMSKETYPLDLKEKDSLDFPKNIASKCEMTDKHAPMMIKGTLKPHETQPASSFTNKSVELIKKSTSSTTAGNRLKVQVVEVSMGATQSLSAFPYIQQMILPEGQVPTSAQSSTAQNTPFNSPIELKELSKSSNLVPVTITGNAQARKSAPLLKPQTVQTQSKVKLSVSIQTSVSKHRNPSNMKQMLSQDSAFLPSGSKDVEHFPMVKVPVPDLKTAKAESSEKPGAKLEPYSFSDRTVKLQTLKPISSNDQTMKPQTTMPITAANKGKGKRKRTLSGAETATKRCNKENFIV